MTHCDLYPVIPSLHALSELQEQLPALLAHEAVTALRLCFDSPLKQDQLETLRQMAWGHDVALILAPADLGLLKDVPLNRIDGVHFTRPADVKTFASRKDRPRDLQIGCTCQTLDDAMSAGEQGADYICLPASGPSSLTQWSLFAELPSVAEDVRTADEALAAIQAGADFLAITLTPPAGEALSRFATVSAALS